MTTRQPFAPASMILRTVEWPARRKCHPRSSAFAITILRSLRCTVFSPAILFHLLEDDLQVHGLLVPRRAHAMRTAGHPLRRRTLVGVDPSDDHPLGVRPPEVLRVRHRGLDDLLEVRSEEHTSELQSRFDL